MDIGRSLGRTEESKLSATDEDFGDVLISTTGKKCTADEIVWEVLEGSKPKVVTKDTKVCFLLDMCRFFSSF